MKRLFLSLLALSALALLLGWLLLRSSLPSLDGEIELAGLKEPATIERDAAGVPVITAQSRQDLAFATGYVHGQDRFFQMDLIRRQAAGELSALFGPIALDIDKQHRFHRFRTRAQAVIENAPPQQQELLASYANGVNAGLASLRARPFEYFVIGHTPKRWLAEDSMLVVYAMFMQLNDERARRDVRRGYVYRVLPASVYDWLYTDGTSWDAPLMGEPRELRPLPTSAELSIRDFPGQEPPPVAFEPTPVLGSNNWVVSGALTGSGRALMSNDMHLGLAVPNIYYRARLVVAGEQPVDLTGVSLPGTPFVVAGSNRQIAWGYTNSYGDWSDAVILRAGDEPGTYRTPDGDRRFVVHTETIEVDGASPVKYAIRETVWGPVDDLIEYPDGEVAVSWIAHHAEALNLNLLQLETAENVAEALDTANTMGLPPQNFVVGDSRGNIGWTIAGRIPKKSGFDAMVPADWSKQAGWTGWRDPSEYPRIMNPPTGRIWTANARVADGGALDIIGDGGYDLAARARQIRDGLLASDYFTAEDMLAIQLDDRALFLGRWRELLLELLDDAAIGDDADLAEFRRLVDDWLPRASPDSTGYRLVRDFRTEVLGQVWAGLMLPVQAAYAEPVDTLISSQFEGPLWQLLQEQPAHLLPANYASWDALLLDAVRTNIASYDERYDSPLSERTWGEFNAAEIRHPLSAGLGFFSAWLDMPAVPQNGDSNMPRAQGQDWGASERFSVAPGDEQNGLMQMPGGQSGHPLSAYYRSEHGDWQSGQPRPFMPGVALHRLSLLPIHGTMDDRNQH